MTILSQLHRPCQSLLLPRVLATRINIQTASMATKKKPKKKRTDDDRPSKMADPVTTPILRSHVTHRKSLATPPTPLSTRLLEKQQSLQDSQSSSTDDDTGSVSNDPPLLYDFTSLRSKMSPKLQQLFHLTNANSSQIARARKARAIELFQIREGDTGSSAAQIAALTSRIQQMQVHSKVHRKDHSGKRGLIALFTRRRKMLDYLERKDFDTYCVVVKALNLVR